MWTAFIKFATAPLLSINSREVFHAAKCLQADLDALPRENSRMTNKLALTVLLMCIGSAASAQQKSMETMDGQCLPNSHMTVGSQPEIKNKTVKPNRYQCSGALIVEYNNGRVVVIFSQKNQRDNGLALGFAGTYSKVSPNPANRVLNVDGTYFYGKDFDQNRQKAEGHCEIAQSGGKVIFVDCFAGTPLEGNSMVASGIKFKATSYSLDSSDKLAPAPTQTQPKPAPSPSQPQREPWYGVSADGNRCVPTDMSPAERIEWLRKQGIRYDAIDRDGMTVNGRPPKVTIIPKGSNYRSWVYYASQATCEEAETRIDKYR